MVGRNDVAIANVMMVMTQTLARANANAIQRQQAQGRGEELRLDRFMRNHPSTFKGRYDPEGARTWLQGIERIFKAMVTTEYQKERLTTHMLAEEADEGEKNTRRGDELC